MDCYDRGLLTLSLFASMCENSFTRLSDVNIHIILVKVSFRDALLDIEEKRYVYVYAVQCSGMQVLELALIYPKIIPFHR